MTSFTLADGIRLRSLLTKQVQELEQEMLRVAFTLSEKGQALPEQRRSVDGVDSDIKMIRQDIMLLDRLIYKANLATAIDYQGEQIPLVEAIEYAMQLRAQAKLYKQLGASPKEQPEYGYGEAAAYMRVARFDPEEYREKALQYERNANKVSGLVNAKNYQVELEFDASRYE